MVLINGGAGGSVEDLQPLPPFATPQELLADALPLMQPVSRMSVTEAAERYVRVQTAGVWQAFDREAVPYMVEPADMMQSRLYRCVCVVAPSQSGKTFMLITTAMHAVMCDPGPVQIIHMTKTDADAWVEESLNPTILNSPHILDRLGKGNDDNTFSRKRFKGMRIAIGYPVANQLSSRKQRLVLMTDYDHFPQRLGGKDDPEGTPHGMGLQRIKSFMSRGTLGLESTPAFAVTDPTWQPRKAAPHEMPPVKHGIVRIYNEGTRARWNWRCRDCDEMFEPTFDKLRYNSKLNPEAAGESAEMVCPHCGVAFSHKHKRENNRLALAGAGGWMHEGQDGNLVHIGDSAIRQSDTVSYALNGAAATFANWRDLVATYEKARRRVDDDGDEIDLRNFFFTDLGVPYVPVNAGDDEGLTLSELKSDRLDICQGVAPSWTRFITVTIDVQKTYFPVMVTAWDENGRRAVVDRFDLTQPPCGSERALAPHKYISDWDVLTPLEEKVIPVEGADFGLTPVAIVYDYQGLKGVSDHAEKFWRARKADGQGAKWFTSRGYGGFTQRDRVWHVAPERASRGKAARGIRLLNMATDRLKDTIAAALAKPNDVDGAMLLPEWMGDDGLNEFIAEFSGEKGWEKKPGRTRNENLDLSVQAQAVAEHKGLRRVNPENLPDWMCCDLRNPHFVRKEQDQQVEKPKSAPPQTVAFLNRGR